MCYFVKIVKCMGDKKIYAKTWIDEIQINTREKANKG